MSEAALFSRQFRVDMLRFWRNTQSRYFTILLPIVFLVIFAAIFKGVTVVEGHVMKLTTFYVPGIMAMGLISASYVNLTQAVVTRREGGELKRLRGTPLPAAYVICSRAAVGVVIAVVMAVILLVIGNVAYGVPVPHALGALLVAIVVGAAAFACVGFAVSTVITTVEAAAPATNLTVLPLYFISGVFVPERQIPAFLRDIAEVFPIYHLARALREPFIEAHGGPFAAGDIAVLILWGVVSLAVAARRFRWTPSDES
ncbi:MAG TPA: ABC transporter permease [Solirubrobacteraceae bacterium]|nr:ABC transporter permease [Solirubrobacteraceae bacterium]